MSDLPVPDELAAATVGTPTVRFYAQLQRAFDHFNQMLFEGLLTPCLITMRSSNRHNGYVSANRAVIDHLRAGIGGTDVATLLAVDGDLSRGVPGQLTRLPAGATHLAISVGGNDALECLPTLDRPVGEVMGAFMHLSQIQANFARN